MNSHSEGANHKCQPINFISAVNQVQTTPNFSSIEIAPEPDFDRIPGRLGIPSKNNTQREEAKQMNFETKTTQKCAKVVVM